MNTTSKHEFANPTFALDALLSAGLGFALIVGADHIPSLSGGGLAPATLRIIGLLLLPWAVHNYRASKETPLSALSFGVQVGGDMSWVVGSMYLLVVHGADFTPLGWILYAPQLLLVSAIALGKVASFRRWRMAAARAT